MTKTIPGFTGEMREACAAFADAREHSAKTQKAANELYAQQTGDGGRALSDAFCDHAADVAAGIAAAIRAMSVASPLPEPMREAPEPKSIYWLAMPHASDFSMETEWRGNKSDLLWLARGLCHATRESAEEHGGYLASLSAKMEDGV